MKTRRRPAYPLMTALLDYRNLCRSVLVNTRLLTIRELPADKPGIEKMDAEITTAADEILQRVKGNRPDDHPFTWGDLRLMLAGHLRAALAELDACQLGNDE